MYSAGRAAPSGNKGPNTSALERAPASMTQGKGRASEETWLFSPVPGERIGDYNIHPKWMRQASWLFILPCDRPRMGLPRLRSHARLLQGRREQVWMRHRPGTAVIADMSLALKINSAPIAGVPYTRQRPYLLPKPTFPFRPRHRPGLPLLRHSKPKGHNSHGHGDIPSSPAV